MSRDTNVTIGMVPCRKGCHCKDCRFDKLEAENKRLTEVVIRYAQHDEGCSLSTVHRRECDCGLAKALEDKPKRPLPKTMEGSEPLSALQRANRRAASELSGFSDCFEVFRELQKKDDNGG